jgi:hypothetical protein
MDTYSHVMPGMQDVAITAMEGNLSIKQVEFG